MRVRLEEEGILFFTIAFAIRQILAKYLIIHNKNISDTPLPSPTVSTIWFKRDLVDEIGLRIWRGGEYSQIKLFNPKNESLYMNS